MVENRKITVTDAGPGWIVVDKPQGVSVHNDPGRDVISFVSELLEKDSKIREKTSTGEPFVTGPAHRLDRETSGIMILGLTKTNLAWLSGQFEKREVVKKYIAVVHGLFNAVDGADFVWEFPLSSGSSGRKNIGGFGKKQKSLTKVRLLDCNEKYSLIECEPVTGRIHQIRRHAAISGHPVLGDKRYGSTKAVNFLKSRCLFDRLGLHSRSISIRTLEGGAVKMFESPVPEIFISMMQKDV